MFNVGPVPTGCCSCFRPVGTGPTEVNSGLFLKRSDNTHRRYFCFRTQATKLLNHFVVCQQQLDRVVVATERLFFWDKLVNRVVAFPAHTDGFLHLFSRVVLFEPLVAMASPWNQMVLCGPTLGNASTKSTWLLRLVHCIGRDPTVAICEHGLRIPTRRNRAAS